MRRTPGLRREEVARLAHVSVEHYTRLEQARGAAPSRRVLAALDRALHLTDDQRAHLYALAGQAVDPPSGPPQEVPRSILDLLDRLSDSAAMVVDARYDVLAWNPLAAALLEDFSRLPPRHLNLIRRHFVVPAHAQRHYGMSGVTGFSRFAAAQRRTALARYPHDPELPGLIRELRAQSPEFAGLWQTSVVHTVHHSVKTMRHRVAGPLELSCDVLTVPDRDQHLIVFTAEPHSSSDQALRLLAVIGTQTVEPCSARGQALTHLCAQTWPRQRRRAYVQPTTEMAYRLREGGRPLERADRHPRQRAQGKRDVLL